MRFLAILSSAIGILMAGCDHKPQEVSVTADELLLALGGRVFTVLTPEHVDPAAFAGLALKYPDGTITRFSSANGLKPKQELKVILMEPREGNLCYTILGDHLMHRVESTHFPGFGAQAANPKSTRIEVGQPLVRFGASSVSLPFGNLNQGEFDLIFHIGATGRDPVSDL